MSSWFTPITPAYPDLSGQDMMAWCWFELVRIIPMWRLGEALNDGPAGYRISLSRRRPGALARELSDHPYAKKSKTLR